jgi:uncharacterized membrane protein YbaN (DUF454 family)
MKMPQQMEEPPSAGELPSRRTLRVFALPPELPEDDERLRAAAASLLRHAHVRSVSMDIRRREAVIRLHTDEPLPGDAAGSIPVASPFTQAEPSAVISWTDAATGTVCFIKRPQQVRGVRKLMLRLAAAMALLLALLGVALPGLPTTPFVLLASYCLVRTSPALHERLLHGRLFGGVLRDWHLHRGIRPHIRVKATVLIGVVVAASVWLMNESLPMMLAVAAIAAVGVWYVWRLPDIEE